MLLMCTETLASLHDFDQWDRVLKRYVNSDGYKEGFLLHTIDYCGLMGDPDFYAFVGSLAMANTSGLSRNETYALYINAYNALAMKMIIDHRSYNGTCIKSIQDIGKLANGTVVVWDMPAGVIGGRTMSLNDIEGFLRDPSSLGYTEDCRVHGCIVCASISCPNVRKEAYLPEKIDEQMSDNVRDWLANQKKGSDVLETHLNVTAILKFFPGDFKKCYGSSVGFLELYGPSDVANAIKKRDIKDSELGFFQYNWNVNGHVPCQCPTSELVVWM